MATGYPTCAGSWQKTERGNKMIYRLVKASGEVERMTTRKPLTLKQMQKMVGGYIELVPYGTETVCCNEEGRLKHLPVNKFYRDFVGDIIFGKTEEGEFVGL